MQIIQAKVPNPQDEYAWEGLYLQAVETLKTDKDYTFSYCLGDADLVFYHESEAFTPDPTTCVYIRRDNPVFESVNRWAANADQRNRYLRQLEITAFHFKGHLTEEEIRAGIAKYS
jgi:hypothetical protein